MATTAFDRSRPIFGVLTNNNNNNNSHAVVVNNTNASINSLGSNNGGKGVSSSNNNNSHHKHHHHHHHHPVVVVPHQEPEMELQLATFLEGLEKQLDKKLDALKSDWIDCKQEQQEVHFKGMMKMPKPIRQMTVREFNESFQCNLLNVLLSSSSSSSKTNTATTTTSGNTAASKKRDIMHLETPVPTKKQNNNHTVLPTPFRTVRRGETLFSKNGSPVDPVDHGALVATVTKKQRGNLTVAEAAAQFDINVGEGKYISLNNPRGIHDLDDSMKKQAVLQLEVLQDQMTNLMAQLKKNI